MKTTLLAFVLGAWCLQQQANLPSPWLLLALPPLMLATLRWRHNALLWFFLIPGALLAGFLWAGAVAHLRLADALPLAWEGQDILVTGVVADLPQTHERGQRFVFDVESTLTPEAHVPARISLNVYTPGADFHAGERWQLTVRLKRPHGNANPHGFDFEAWALERNIRASGYVRKSSENLKLEALAGNPAYRIEHWRENLRDKISAALAGQPLEGVIRALAIGDDDGIARPLWQVFQRTGVIHLMSISGLHITMISGLVFALVQALWRRSPLLALRLPARKAAVLAGMCTALSYALIAGFAIPAQRTVYMLAVVGIALWSGRHVGFPLILAWALAVTTLLDPWAVLAPGFWLSFGAVALIAFVAAGRLQRPHWLHEAVNTQWAVTLGLTPILLALFQQTSLISPLANAFAIPLVSLLVTPLTLLGCVLPGDWLLQAAHGVMQGCMALLEYLNTLPVAVWQQAAPPWWTVLLALLGVLWMLLPRGVPARWLGAVLCLPMFTLSPAPPQPGAMRVTVLDVGQGLAVVVQTARHALLYDTGPRYNRESDSGNRVIAPYLRAVGIFRLDGMVVSHDDNDHSGGALSVLQEVPTGWLASSLPNGHEITQQAPNPRPCFAGQHWQWDGVSFDMLHPVPGILDSNKKQDNERSCVLKVSSRYGSLLLTGDIGRASEQALLDTLPDKLKADALVAPHHGSKSSSSAGFVQQVKPGVVIFTSGYRNRFGHPNPDVVARYRALGSLAYRSDQDGALKLEFGKQGISVDAWRRTGRRYWQTAE
jgi:competence protein ComEC